MDWMEERHDRHPFERCICRSYSDHQQLCLCHGEYAGLDPNFPGSRGLIAGKRRSGAVLTRAL